jgi:hypothetical protein
MRAALKRPVPRRMDLLKHIRDAIGDITAYTNSGRTHFRTCVVERIR